METAKFIYKDVFTRFYKEIENGNKNFEIRRYDKDVRVGDFLVLTEYDDIKCVYTGNVIVKEVKYILYGCPQFGLMDGYCIYGF